MRPGLLFPMILLAASSQAQIPDVRQLARDIAAQSSDSEQEVRVTAFMEQVRAIGTPLLENDTTAVFIYHGPGKRVRISGDMTHWASEVEFARIPNTDVHYYRGTYPAEARLEYALIVDDHPPIPDPLCPNKVLNGLGALSELVMPAYRYHPIFEAVRGGTFGNYDRVTQYQLPTGIMGYPTEIHVYAPPGYDTSEDSFPAVFLQDGPDYIEYAHTPAALDHLIESEAIAPILAVFISPPNRHQPATPNRATEYGLNPDYAHFMAEELVPFVQERYRTIAQPSARLVAGPSFGGLVSAYVPFRHPDIFGLSYSQSGYLSFRGDSLLDAYERSGRKSVRLFVDIGRYERSVGRGWLPDDEVDFLAANRRFQDLLAAKGYDFVYREYPEGHTWGNWRAHLMDALAHFFPAGITH
ncbi:MAG: alpha/beta hydrolase-fold protein [Bacteroidota bacterium]|nr:alpha/beta hydrolase-fold protein [Bacteroidota bacterium]